MSKYRLEIQKVNKSEHRVYLKDVDCTVNIDISNLIKDISINIYPFESDIRVEFASDRVRYIDNTKYLD